MAAIITPIVYRHKYKVKINQLQSSDHTHRRKLFIDIQTAILNTKTFASYIPSEILLISNKAYYFQL